VWADCTISGDFTGFTAPAKQRVGQEGVKGAEEKMNFNIASDTVITDFNLELLRANTPLRTEEEALEILTLISPIDMDKMYKILDGTVPFVPENTYCDRLYKALALAEL
jgi:hypothetical protein